MQGKLDAPFPAAPGIPLLLGEASPEELSARTLLFQLKAALLSGTKYYHLGTHEPLTTPQKIVQCLLAENEVAFETASYRHLAGL